MIHVRPYVDVIEMPYIEGKTLEDVLAATDGQAREAAMRQAVDIADDGIRKGVLPKDFRGANIQVGKDGKLTILDPGGILEGEQVGINMRFSDKTGETYELTFRVFERQARSGQIPLPEGMTAWPKGDVMLSPKKVNPDWYFAYKKVLESSGSESYRKLPRVIYWGEGGRVVYRAPMAGFFEAVDWTSVAPGIVTQTKAQAAREVEEILLNVLSKRLSGTGNSFIERLVATSLRQKLPVQPKVMLGILESYQLEFLRKVAIGYKAQVGTWGSPFFDVLLQDPKADVKTIFSKLTGLSPEGVARVPVQIVEDMALGQLETYGRIFRAGPAGEFPDFATVIRRIAAEDGMSIAVEVHLSDWIKRELKLGGASRSVDVLIELRKFLDHDPTALRPRMHLAANILTPEETVGRIRDVNAHWASLPENSRIQYLKAMPEMAESLARHPNYSVRTAPLADAGFPHNVNLLLCAARGSLRSQIFLAVFRWVHPFSPSPGIPTPAQFPRPGRRRLPPT
jgi:hypothetical protein